MTWGITENKLPISSASSSIKFNFSPSPFADLLVAVFPLIIFSYKIEVISFVIFSLRIILLKSKWFSIMARINLIEMKAAVDSTILNFKFINISWYVLSSGKKDFSEKIVIILLKKNILK